MADMTDRQLFIEIHKKYIYGYSPVQVKTMLKKLYVSGLIDSQGQAIIHEYLWSMHQKYRFSIKMYSPKRWNRLISDFGDEEIKEYVLSSYAKVPNFDWKNTQKVPKKDKPKKLCK